MLWTQKTVLDAKLQQTVWICKLRHFLNPEVLNLPNQQQDILRTDLTSEKNALFWVLLQQL